MTGTPGRRPCSSRRTCPWRGGRARRARHRGGAIVNTSSATGLTGTPELSAYAASKFGVIGRTRSVAVECAAEGIRVNAVCAGLVATPMLAAFTQAHPDWLTGTYLPQGRMADPDDIAAAVVWLCSPDAGHVNGVALPVDG